MSNKISNMHALRRTNPKSEIPFIGICVQCGKQNLTFKDMQSQECISLKITFNQGYQL